jgi:hypothetical protein
VRREAVDKGEYVWEPQLEKSWQMPVRRRGGADS